MVLCPEAPEQVERGKVSREDLEVLRAWGDDCQSRQASCIKHILTNEGGNVPLP